MVCSLQYACALLWTHVGRFWPLFSASEAEWNMTQSAIIQYLSFRNPICLAPAWTCSASHISHLVKCTGIKLCVARNYYKIVGYTSHVSYYVSVSYISKLWLPLLAFVSLNVGLAAGQWIFHDRQWQAVAL